MPHSYNSTEIEKLQAILENKLQLFKEHKKLKETKVDTLLLPALSPSRADQVKHCADDIALDDDGHVVYASYCKHRLCPVCVWRNAAKKWHKTYSIIAKLEQSKTYVFALLTLTIRNCAAKDLKDTIDELMKAINRLNANDRFKARVKGFIRSLEITYNPDQKDGLVYHPHYHFILALDEDYMTNADKYLSAYDWRMMWQKAAKLDYTAQIDIRLIQGDDLCGAVAEVSKYAVKSADVFKTAKTTADIAPLLSAISGRRLYSLGGVIKAAAKAAAKEEKEQQPSREEYREKSAAAHWYKYEKGTYRPRDS